MALESGLSTVESAGFCRGSVGRPRYELPYYTGRQDYGFYLAHAVMEFIQDTWKNFQVIR
jgi:hypothetical protein